MKNARYLVVSGIVAAAAATVYAATPVASPAGDRPLPGAIASAVPVGGAPMPAPGGSTGATTVAPSAPQLDPQQAAFFEAKIRPIFVSSCYKCHSVEQGKNKGGLVLDSREGWAKGGDNGPAIIPGDAAKSKVLIAVSYKMPPKGEKLTAQQISDLTAWVKMGAPDPRVGIGGAGKLTGLNDKARAHWAYQPVKKSPVPDVKNKAWVRTPIDSFVLSKLEQNALTPSQPASKETLIRRASYDLIGLPPTPEEVKAFVNDHSPNAFEKVVDRLLASPHYGERWGRFWLDTARYADTTGSDAKNEDYRYEYAWTYRDWVINSFNSDLPYDQFLKKQIAADLLPGADKDPDSLAALGFLTVGKRFINKNDTIDERIDTVTKATMAMTVSCARCHDHKFDPIPTADYYSLHGLFSSIDEPEEKPLVGRQPSPGEKADYEKKLAEMEAKNRQAYYSVLEEQGSEWRKKATGYILSSFYSNGTYKDPVKKLQAVKEFDLEGSKNNGQLLTVARVERRGNPVFAPFQWFADLPEDQFSQKAPEVLERIARGELPQREMAFKGGLKEGKKGYLYIPPVKGDLSHVNALVVAAFKSVSPSSLHNIRDVAEVYGKLFASIEGQAKAYIDASRKATSDKVSGFDDATAQLIETPFPVDPAPTLTDEHLRDLSTSLALGENAYNRFVFNELNELTLTNPGSPGRAMVVADLSKPVDSPIFIRGDAQTRGKIVPRQFLEILSGPNRQPFKVGSGRLELAQDIASPANPMTARVLVNRVWMHHFGEGIVRTPDDLGVQSEPPSHPELLDYLAARFMDTSTGPEQEGLGWSVKKLHKLIMLSSAYQQSSDTNANYAKIDPANKLLWRANLRRLDFEAIRDTLLMFTGKLDPTLGGKPVNLTDEPYSNRRSVYGYVDRGRLPELMSQFDFSDPNRPNSKRTTTIVPQQALFFMNSPMSADVARKVCSRPEFVNARDDYARVRALYEVLYQREAKPVEVQLAAQFYNETVSSGANKEGPQQPAAAALRQKRISAKAAATMTNNGKASIQNTGETVERKPLTTWELYAQALLFTNELAYVN
jgi:cytochrome c553